VFQDQKFIRRAVCWTWDMYINSHKKTLTRRSSFNRFSALLIICCFHISVMILFLFLKTKFNFKRTNFFAINNYLNNINWDQLGWGMELKELNVDGAVNFVYYHLNHIIDSYEPSYTISRFSYPTWFSKEDLYQL